MKAKEIREKFIDFYKKRDHVFIPPAPLIPEQDSTLLFVNSGMFPLVPYLLGEEHPEGKRLVNFQKCFRSDDIEEIGDMRHTTLFEMLGNWSLGDYFKEEQIPWVFDFFVDEIGLDPKKIYISVYRGDKEIGIEKDSKAAQIWKDVFEKRGIASKEVDFAQEKGMQEGRIFYYSKDNWWSRSGPPESMPLQEPGGPDSEIFYDLGESLGHHKKSQWKNEPCHVNCDCGRFIEIGNSVFIQFIKTENGFEKLPKKNVDFGGGLERIAMISQGKTSIFETDLFLPIIRKIEEISSFKYRENVQSFEVIADHVKAATFIIGDEKGVSPSNKQQGYFVRRLLRRSMRHGRILNIDSKMWIKDVAREVIEIYKDVYPEIEKNKDFVYEMLEKEENAFNKMLEKGIKEFEKIENKEISGKKASFLYQTYGFPLELIEEMAKERGQKVDKEGFYEDMEKHKKLSRDLSAGVFKSGLADESENTVKYHTATHLLLAALREILGETVVQKGSNINRERLRFDFSFERKLSKEEISQVEEKVNDMIKKDLVVSKEEMDTKKALESGVVASFEEKYPSRVLVYTISDKDGNVFSREICSGPHVEKTSLLGKLIIKKEESSSSGVRRIKAILK